MAVERKENILMNYTASGLIIQRQQQQAAAFKKRKKTD